MPAKDPQPLRPDRLPGPARGRGPGRPADRRHHRQPLHPPDPGGQRLARRAPALALPVHPRPRLLAQPEWRSSSRSWPAGSSRTAPSPAKPTWPSRCWPSSRPTTRPPKPSAWTYSRQAARRMRRTDTGATTSRPPPRSPAARRPGRPPRRPGRRRPRRPGARSRRAPAPRRGSSSPPGAVRRREPRRAAGRA